MGRLTMILGLIISCGPSPRAWATQGPVDGHLQALAQLPGPQYQAKAQSLAVLLVGHLKAQAQQCQENKKEKDKCLSSVKSQFRRYRQAQAQARANYLKGVHTQELEAIKRLSGDVSETGLWPKQKSPQKRN